MDEGKAYPMNDGTNQGFGMPTPPQAAGQPQGAGQAQAADRPQNGQPQAAGQQASFQPQASQPSQQPGYAQPQAAPAAGFAAPAAPAAQIAAAPAKQSHSGLIALGIVAAAIVLIFGIGAASCSAAIGSLSSIGSAGDASSLSTYGDSVAVITMSGTIGYDGSACSPEGLRAALKSVEADDDIKAVVLRVNSGGGTSTAGEEMSQLIAGFDKPIVVSSASINCSAAYEVSSQADYIYVNHSTAIGAIGTIMQTYDASELLDKLGIKVNSIASAESKDSSYGTRPLTDEEREYYQNLVSQINAQFVSSVASGRGMSVAQVQELATGMEFTGDDAVANGLADEIGTYDDALAKAAELGGIKGDFDVVDADPSRSDLASLLGISGSTKVSISADDLAAALAKLDEAHTVR